MTDTHTRSILKGASWRAVGTLDTMVIAYAVTGRIAVAGTIGAVEVVTKIALYWLHERIWTRIPLR